jgi:hypothetical protein
MRLALAFLACWVLVPAPGMAQQMPAFFMNATLTHAQTNHIVQFDVVDPRCERVLEPLLAAAQIYDVINTRNQLARYAQARESDWWTARFAGAQRRNIVGITFGIALLDAIKWKLTAHSPALRCAAEAGQLQTTIEAIRITHPR